VLLVDTLTLASGLKLVSCNAIILLYILLIVFSGFFRVGIHIFSLVILILMSIV